MTLVYADISKPMILMLFLLQGYEPVQKFAFT
jgi:hypothetical protein